METVKLVGDSVLYVRWRLFEENFGFTSNKFSSMVENDIEVPMDVAIHNEVAAKMLVQDKIDNMVDEFTILMELTTEHLLKHNPQLREKRL